MPRVTKGPGVYLGILPGADCGPIDTANEVHIGGTGRLVELLRRFARDSNMPAGLRVHAKYARNDGHVGVRARKFRTGADPFSQIE